VCWHCIPGSSIDFWFAAVAIGLEAHKTMRIATNNDPSCIAVELDISHVFRRSFFGIIDVPCKYFGFM
jgi:hypothetical protein